MEYVDLVAFLASGHQQPPGTDRWGIRTVASRHGFQWPAQGWAEAPGPILDHAGDAPLAVGDGLCLAHNWAGLATVNTAPADLLLVAYDSADALGPVGHDTVRVRRAHVVTKIDGLELVTRYATGADLRGAQLSGARLAGAVLYGANLSQARLARTQLTGASLYGADLSGADLSHTTLVDADLRYADLTNANLAGAITSTGTRLDGADLHGANLTGCQVSTATFRDPARRPAAGQ